MTTLTVEEMVFNREVIKMAFLDNDFEWNDSKSVESNVLSLVFAATEWLEDSKFLNRLRAAGVDNWDGYEIASEAYENL